MNTRVPRREGSLAFTLIELITVIAIIAILMGLLFPVLGRAKEQALRAKAGTAVGPIVTACNAYASDYGKYPPVPGATAGGGSAQNSQLSFGDTQNGRCQVKNTELFDVLRAIDRGSNAQQALNRRQQVYFNDNKAAADPRFPREGFADGKDFPDSIQGQFLDPWGYQYCVVLDGDGDGTLKLDSFFSDLTEVVRAPAVAFSMAKDGAIGGKGYQGRLRKPNSAEPQDDITSW